MINDKKTLSDNQSRSDTYTFFEYVKCFMIGCTICLLIAFIVCMIDHPFITITVMCGIGIIAFIIKCVCYLATFWLPGGDLWKM